MDPFDSVRGFLAISQAFKGTLDAYLLLESFFWTYEESGLRDLALLYHIECQNFENWGDRHNIHAENPKDCPLFHESDYLKQLILDIVQRIRKLHVDAREFLEVHDGDQVVINYEIVDSPKQFVDNLGNTVKGGSQVSERQARRKHKSRIKWAIKNKEKFEKVVHSLRQYNEGLERLLNRQTQTAFKITLPGRILASINDEKDLEAVHRLRASEDALLSHAAKLKTLEVFDNSANRQSLIKFLPVSDFILKTQSPEQSKTSSRITGIYKQVQRTWIEWSFYDANLSPAIVTHLKERVRRLGAMLSAESTQQLGTAHCIGVVREQDADSRLGLVFQTPPKYGMASPYTLFDAIHGTSLKSAKSMAEPPLGHKFALARKLSSSIALLHASGWLHKAFTSHNILLFGPAAEPDSLLDPYITGFKSSREVTAESYGYRPTGSGSMDYYYHPDTTSGFTKSKDLYSFGIVLLEIAYWRPLHTKIQKAGAKTLKDIQKLFIASAKTILPAMVGSIYADVVTRCLECSLPDESDEEFTCAMGVDIISKLEQCKA